MYTKSGSGKPRNNSLLAIQSTAHELVPEICEELKDPLKLVQISKILRVAHQQRLGYNNPGQLIVLRLWYKN